MQYTEPIANVWVCVDCMLARENDEHDSENVGCKPWSHLYGSDVSANWDSETGDGVSFYSQEPCQACGCIFYGERYRYAVWAW